MTQKKAVKKIEDVKPIEQEIEVKEAVKEAPKPRHEKRLSNSDIHEILKGLQADVQKEMVFRKRDLPVVGKKGEKSEQLVGLHQGLVVVAKRFEIFGEVK